MHKIELVCGLAISGSVLGVLLYQALMLQFRRRNYAPEMVRSFALKIGVGYAALLTLFMAMSLEH